MTQQVRSELLKIGTTRTTRRLAVAMLALVLLFVAVPIVAMDARDLAEADTQRMLVAAGGLATIFAGILGVMAATTEFRHGTIRPTLLVSPRRLRVVAAKVVASVAAGAVLGAVAEAVATGVAYAGLAAQDVDLMLTADEVLGVSGGIVAAAALWAGVGVGLGVAVRSQVAAIVSLLLWVFVVEPILHGLVPSVGRYAPGIASEALAGAGSENLLPPLGGGFVLAGYVLLLGACGGALLARRDA